MRKLEVLLLVVNPKGAASTISDHIHALQRYSRHRVTVVQNYLALLGPIAKGVSALPARLPLNRFDVLVIHYSNYLAHPAHFDEASRERIRAFPNLKVVLIQDEYRTVDATIGSLRELGVDVLFTCVPEEEIEKVYSNAALPGVRKVPTLTGFVPEHLTRIRVPSLAARKVDIGYRTRMVPFWLGELGAEKWQIVPRFLSATEGRSLTTDLSFQEKDRLYGKRWIGFLTSCRSVLGVESGASVFDFTGEVQRNVDAFVSQNPDATFEEVQARFFLDLEHRIKLNQISPRSFEAAALRTAMVLYEGEYSGILKPHRHYVPLKKDFSNIDEVVATIKDLNALTRLVACAFEEIALNPEYSYRTFVARIDEVIEHELSDRGKLDGGPRKRQQLPSTVHPWRTARLKAIPGAGAAHWRLRARWERLQLRPGLPMRVIRPHAVAMRLLTSVWTLLPDRAKQRLRPLARRVLGLDR